MSLNGAYSMKQDPPQQSPVGLHSARMKAPRTQEVEADVGTMNAAVASPALLLFQNDF